MTNFIVELENKLSKFIHELETEDRLVRVGLKDVSESAKIYKKYKDLFTKETLDAVSAALKGSKDAKEKDILDRIYFTLAGSFMGLELAADSDKITTYFSKATVTVGGEKIAYFEIAPRISKDPIYARREKADDAGTVVVSKANSKQQALLDGEIKLLKSLGFGGYFSFYKEAKKVDFDKFAKVVKKTIGDTDKLWNSVMGKVSADVLGMPFKNVRSCHMTYLRSISMYDNYFPKDKVVETFQKWTRDIGLSDLLAPVKIDDVDRAKKNPRAVCYPSDPPKEVHLVIKPIGGEQDYEAMFHEGGHSLHFTAVDPKLPYSYRALSNSNALTETYAFILEDLVFDPMFLTTYLNVSQFTGAKINWQAHFVNLMLLRRYLGKYSYEYALFSKGQALGSGPSLYKKNLEATTGFIHKKENWLSDMDGGFYSADYLRAWIAAAQIKDYLERKFGKKWFLNKKAGDFLRKLWVRGVQDEVEDVVAKLGYKPWDTSLLVKNYKKILA